MMDAVALLAVSVVLAAQLAAAALLGLALFAFLGPRRRARIVGGNSDALQAILQKMPLLFSCPRGPLDFSSSFQLLVYALQMTTQERVFGEHFETEVEEFEVTLPGESTTGHPDRVAITWILREAGAPQRELPPDAPIVIMCPGLNCYTASLPGTASYKSLLQRPWRVGAFDKRGVGPLDGESRRLLQSPVFHLFGHPSDLHVALLQVQKRWPKAPIHLVGQSSGNGLAGSYMAIHGKDLPSLRSVLLLIGGEDYNCAFAPPKGNWLTYILFDVALLTVSKERFLKRNERILRKHNPQAYEAALKVDTLQGLYDLCMRHFSGYSCPAEAERRINGFSGGCDCLKIAPVPFLVVFTDDDPVAPGGPRPSWISTIGTCDNAACAVFPCGSHLGCYDSLRLTRWLDPLMRQWLDAFAE